MSDADRPAVMPSRYRFSVPAGHPSLAGHFPGNPVVPGVLVLDHVLQVAEAHCGWTPGPHRLPQVKFLKPLLPEQIAEVELERVDAARLRFRIVRDGELLASGELGVDA